LLSQKYDKKPEQTDETKDKDQKDQKEKKAEKPPNNYVSMVVGASMHPPYKLCGVCGYPFNYFRLSI
jgi:hypothetical protein